MKDFSRYTVRTPEDTAKLAVEFSASLNVGVVVVLNGSLGAGKTFFIKNAGLYFKVKEINSPTFAIVNEHNGTVKINHLDFYRINSAAELYNIGIDDYLSDNDAITFIEWGNLFPEVLPKKRIEINIIINSDNSRDFIFYYYE